MNKIFEKFKKSKVFLPVIHPYGREGVLESVNIALEAEADGVFLINQGMSITQILLMALELRQKYSDLWIGANLLSLTPIETLDYISLFDGIWVDDCGVDLFLNENELKDGGFLFNVSKGSWDGLYFGGTAFKTQRDLSSKEELINATLKASELTDIVTTSGRRTGLAAELNKIKIMKEVLGPKSLGLASGVTPENIEIYLPYVDAYLVASGIEESFGILDSKKVKELSKKIHNGL